MKPRLSRLFVTAAALGIGVLIGVTMSQSGDRPAGAQAVDAPAPPTAAEAPCCPAGKSASKVQRFGAVIGLKPEKKDYYNALHAKPWPEVNAMLKKCNVRNYSIYEAEFGGKLYLFSYFEYAGDDFKADMAKMAEDETTRKWWRETDPCQIRLPCTPEGQQWLQIPEVYHLD